MQSNMQSHVQLACQPPVCSSSKTQTANHENAKNQNVVSNASTGDHPLLVLCYTPSMSLNEQAIWPPGVLIIVNVERPCR